MIVPPRSKVEQLPAELKLWLDTTLIETGFAGYEVLEREVNQRLELAGAEFRIGRSSIQRYGSVFEERMKSLRMVSQQAKALVDASPDEEDAVSQALIRMVQEKLFTVVMDMGAVDAAKLNMPAITRAIADLARASISNKKYAVEVKERTKAALASVTAVVKKAGLTPEAVNQIRREILGIAG